MPKLLKKFAVVKGIYGSTSMDGPQVIDSDIFFELYKAYKKYYLIVINRSYVITTIRFSNFLTAMMLFKDMQKDALSKGNTISEEVPYWVIPPRFSMAFWKRIKRRRITNMLALTGVFDLYRLKDYLGQH